MAGDRGGDRPGGDPITVFIDTGVFMYAAGREHPLLAITHDVVSLMPELAPEPQRARPDPRGDSHRYAIGVVVSPDTDFDRIAEVERVPPEDRAAVGRLLRS